MRILQNILIFNMLPLIPVVLTDVNLQTILIFILFATELTFDSLGR